MTEKDSCETWELWFEGWGQSHRPWLRSWTELLQNSSHHLLSCWDLCGQHTAHVLPAATCLCSYTEVRSWWRRRCRIGSVVHWHWLKANRALSCSSFSSPFTCHRGLKVPTKQGEQPHQWNHPSAWPQAHLLSTVFTYLSDNLLKHCTVLKTVLPHLQFADSKKMLLHGKLALILTANILHDS